MPSARISLVVLILAIALIGGAWFVLKAVKDPGERPRHATVLPERRPLPEFSLTDDENRPFTRDRLLGHTSLLFFGFTHCPDICPATLQQLASARRRLAEASVPDAGALPQIVLISVDPERDTPEKLKAYVEHFGDGITGVTGTLDELRRLTGALGVFFEKRGSGDDYSVDHSAYVFVIDRNAALQALFGAPHETGSFVHDLPLLTAAP